MSDPASGEPAGGSGPVAPAGGSGSAERTGDAAPGRHPHVEPSDAATVVLLRDGDLGIEAWLLTRVRQMAFAAGMTVFPGGRVDPGDADLPMTGTALEAIAARFGTDERVARALVGAAVRETFEEAGVLLTAPPAQRHEWRTAVERHELPFGELLARDGLAVDADALSPWARWITPPGESRRYDTRFFIGALPEGASASGGTSEASHSAWIPVAVALDEMAAGQRQLLPPTLATLAALRRFDRVADAIAAAAGHTMDPIQPTLRVDGDTIYAELPDGTSFEVPGSMFR